MMPRSMKLSILDQSPIIAGHSAAQALEETLKLARRADTLGYTRYWLAEHHAIGALADPCPEILLARLGAETKRIRIGTGGVLLPYYSAFKTAEVPGCSKRCTRRIDGTPAPLGGTNARHAPWAAAGCPRLKIFRSRSGGSTTSTGRRRPPVQEGPRQPEGHLARALAARLRLQRLLAQLGVPSPALHQRPGRHGCAYRARRRVRR
jgi:hypothetical protein